MKMIVEIHASEGGDDSKLFVSDLAQSYTKWFQRIG
jgi:protein subunit release factor A